MDSNHHQHSRKRDGIGVGEEEEYYPGQEEEGRDPKKNKRRCLKRGNIDASSTAVFRYKVPTDEERKDILDLLTRNKEYGFEQLFRPKYQQQQDAARAMRATTAASATTKYDGLICMEKYINIPEEHKWWKDDEKLILDYGSDMYEVEDGHFLQLLCSKRLRSDNNFILEIVRRRQKYLSQFLPTKESRMTPNKFSNYYDQCIEILNHCEPNVFDDLTFLRRLFDVMGCRPTRRGTFLMLMEHTSQRLKDDPDFVRDMGSMFTMVQVFQFASDRLKDDAEFVLSILRKCIRSCDEQKSQTFDFAKDDKTEVLVYASEQLRDDPKFMQQAQRRCGLCYGVVRFASNRLRNNADFLMGLQKNFRGSVLPFVSDRLRDDGDFILRIWTIRSTILKGRVPFDFDEVSSRLQGEKDFWMEIMKKTGRYELLQNMTLQLNSDVEVVQASVEIWTEHVLDKRSECETSNRHTSKFKNSPLQFARGAALDAPSVVMSSIKYDPLSIQFASRRLRSDENVALLALKSWRDSVPPGKGANRIYKKLWSSISSSLKANEQFVSRALQICPYFLSRRYVDVRDLESKKLLDLVNVSIGYNGSTDESAAEFWSCYHGQSGHRRHLMKFWIRNWVCTMVHRCIRRLDKELSTSGGREERLLPLIDRKEGRKTRVDGFTNGRFDLNDWNRRKWEKIWLVDRAATAYCKLSTADNESCEKVEKLPSDVLRNIVGFAAIDKLIKKTRELQKFVPLFNTMLKRGLVVPNLDQIHSNEEQVMNLAFEFSDEDSVRNRDNDDDDDDDFDSDDYPQRLEDNSEDA